MINSLIDCIYKQYTGELIMDRITINCIKLEQAEFVNRLMIDVQLTDKDIKIGLCLLHELLLKMQQDIKEVRMD